MDKKDLEELLQQHRVESQEQTEQYLGALKEDFDQKLEAVLEYVKDIPGMKDDIESLRGQVRDMKGDVRSLKAITDDIAMRLDATFERVGGISVDVEEIKEILVKHETEIQQILHAE